MKKYENPMLQVVSIKKTDIIATSEDIANRGTVDDPGKILAPGQRGLFDPYDPYNAEY